MTLWGITACQRTWYRCRYYLLHGYSILGAFFPTPDEKQKHISSSIVFECFISPSSKSLVSLCHSPFLHPFPPLPLYTSIHVYLYSFISLFCPKRSRRTLIANAAMGHLQLRAQANVKASEALARAKEERTEASRRLRLAHDAEMRKAGRDILRLEREIRRLEVPRPPKTPRCLLSVALDTRSLKNIYTCHIDILY